MTYFMRGIYEQNNRDYPQVGILAFESDDSISGAIMDPCSDYSKEEIEGKLMIDDGLVTITFTKIPRGNKYIMAKTDGTKTVEGTYEGYWRFDGQSLQSKMEEDKKARMTLDTMV